MTFRPPSFTTVHFTACQPCLESRVWNLVLTGTFLESEEELRGTQHRPGNGG